MYKEIGLLLNVFQQKPKTGYDYNKTEYKVITTSTYKGMQS